MTQHTYTIRFLIMALTILWVGGCSDDKGSAPQQDPNALTPAKCKALLNEYCPRLVYCAGLKGVAVTLSVCQEKMYQGARCSVRTDSSPMYSTCLQDVKSENCNYYYNDMGPNTPQSCDGLLDPNPLYQGLPYQEVP